MYVPLLCLQPHTYVCIVRTPRVCIFWLVFRVPVGLIDFGRSTDVDGGADADADDRGYDVRVRRKVSPAECKTDLHRI